MVLLLLLLLLLLLRGWRAGEFDVLFSILRGRDCGYGAIEICNRHAEKVLVYIVCASTSSSTSCSSSSSDGDPPDGDVKALGSDGSLCGGSGRCELEFNVAGEASLGRGFRLPSSGMLLGLLRRMVIFRFGLGP